MWGDLPDILNIYASDYEEVKITPDLGVILRLRKPTQRGEITWASNTYVDLINGNLLYYVAEEEGNIVGLCYVSKKDVPDSEISHVGVLGIEVAIQYRSRGIASKLLEHTIKECKGKFDILEVSVFANNEVAKHLYKKFGFRKWGIAPGYVKRNGRYIDLEYMCLKL